jgi:hypothetical protein
MSASPRALRLLDEVQHLAQLERFDATAFLDAAREEMNPPGATLSALTAQLDGLRDLLGAIDAFAQKSMRIRVTRLDGLPPQLRTLLYSTVVTYERDLPLLRARVASALARSEASAGADASARILQMAEAVLAARAALRRGVMELAQRSAVHWLPIAQRAARDRSQPDEERARWKRVCVDLEQLSAHGETLEMGSLAERLDRIATPDDLPDEERPDRFSLLELD